MYHAMKCIHILPNCYFIFQMLSNATVHLKKNEKKNEKKMKKRKEKKRKKKTEKEWSWINEVLAWRLGLVWGLGWFCFGFTFYA